MDDLDPHESSAVPFAFDSTVDRAERMPRRDRPRRAHCDREQHLLLDWRFEEAGVLERQVLALARQHLALASKVGTQMVTLGTEEGRLGELETAVRGAVEPYPGLPVWRAFLQAGDRNRALVLLKQAIEIAEELGVKLLLEKVLALELHAQDIASAASASATDIMPSAVERGPSRQAGTPPAACVFRQDGEDWTVGYGGTVCRLKNARGLHHIAQLLRHPGQEFHVLDLVRMSSVGDRVSKAQGPTPTIQHPFLDPQAKAAYRRRLADLDDELEEAERFNDLGRVARAREEMEAISEQLAAGVGLGGRDRVAASDAERARSAVGHSIKLSIKKIADRVPALADHFGARIRTGAFCVYIPDQTRPIAWTL